MQIRSRVGVVSRKALPMSQTAFTPGGNVVSESSAPAASRRVPDESTHTASTTRGRLLMIASIYDPRCRLPRACTGATSPIILGCELLRYLPGSQRRMVRTLRWSSGIMRIWDAVDQRI